MHPRPPRLAAVLGVGMEAALTPAAQPWRAVSVCGALVWLTWVRHSGHMDSSDILVYVGLALTLVGVVVFLWPKARPASEERGVDIAEILKQINLLLDKFDQRYRPGLILMVVGLTIMGFGVYLGTQEETPPATASAVAHFG